MRDLIRYIHYSCNTERSRYHKHVLSNVRIFLHGPSQFRQGHYEPKR